MTIFMSTGKSTIKYLYPANIKIYSQGVLTAFSYINKLSFTEFLREINLSNKKI